MFLSGRLQKQANSFRDHFRKGHLLPWSAGVTKTGLPGQNRPLLHSGKQEGRTAYLGQWHAPLVAFNQTWLTLEGKVQIVLRKVWEVLHSLAGFCKKWAMHFDTVEVFPEQHKMWAMHVHLKKVSSLPDICTWRCGIPYTPLSGICSSRFKKESMHQPLPGALKVQVAAEQFICTQHVPAISLPCCKTWVAQVFLD